MTDDKESRKPQQTNHVPFRIQKPYGGPFSYGEPFHGEPFRGERLWRWTCFNLHASLNCKSFLNQCTAKFIEIRFLVVVLNASSKCLSHAAKFTVSLAELYPTMIIISRIQSVIIVLWLYYTVCTQCVVYHRIDRIWFRDIRLVRKARESLAARFMIETLCRSRRLVGPWGKCTGIQTVNRHVRWC